MGARAGIRMTEKSGYPVGSIIRTKTMENRATEPGICTRSPGSLLWSKNRAFLIGLKPIRIRFYPVLAGTNPDACYLYIRRCFEKTTCQMGHVARMQHSWL